MAKKESSFFNMVFTLFLVTAIASLALGGVYNLTKDEIAKVKAEKLKNAIKKVLPDFDEYEQVMFKSNDKSDSLTFFVAKKEGKEIGVAIKTFTDNGFSGRFWIMVGFTNEGKIFDVAVLEHKETPGLGDKMEKKKSLKKNPDGTESSWSDQFRNIELSFFPLSVKKDGGNIDAITATTISSRAFCDALNRAYNTYKNMKGENNE